MFEVCIDTGGTFTDCVVLDEKNRLVQFKVDTTPGDLSVGLVNSLKEAAAYYDLKAILKRSGKMVLTG